ncbi:sugar ABC transporter ATP-binding protein [Gulosibacter chungangensis]|uniref:Sugar ABC transporter ATP-binding protein n=1 Tax=Gulosibacter chungangensis TaxID=979746 RepID=A0A7J5BAB8_9MICO|nr:sugar ABC transporter ATP-binding protein [Gulosibacter chungangensis]KAB1642707.1 sugar ABC transporter ATP-binding protein [Gulosibacter chungangensis]
MTTANRLEAQHLGKSYGHVHALKDVSITIRPGEIHALIGENGAGKSTLIKILSGVVRHDRGKILLNGQEFAPSNPQDSLRAGVGTVYQDPQIVESLTVAENVFLGRFLTGGSGWLQRKEMIRRTEKLLQSLNISLDPLQLCTNLTVADQQLLQIARAASFSELQLLILDEPTSTLTPTEVERLFTLVDQLRQQGVSILFVSHKLEEIEEHADSVTVFRDGTYVTEYRRDHYSIDDLVHNMVGRELDQVQPKSGLATPQDLRLSLDALSGKGFKNVSFEVHAGEVFGLFGLVGSGRTEILRAIFGADRTSSGSMTLAGSPYQPKSVGDALRSRIALVPEDRRGQGLIPEMSVGENATLSVLKRNSKFGWLSSAAIRQTADDLVKKLGLKTAGINAVITSLSGGNQQKVVIGRWLATEPELLMLDEPAAGIDIGAKNEVYRLVDEVADSGVPVIVVSSELPEILRLCNRVGVMHEGRLVGILPREEATEESLIALATLGAGQPVAQ